MHQDKTEKNTSYFSWFLCVLTPVSLSSHSLPPARRSHRRGRIIVAVCYMPLTVYRMFRDMHCSVVFIINIGAVEAQAYLWYDKTTTSRMLRPFVFWKCRLFPFPDLRTAEEIVNEISPARKTSFDRHGRISRGHITSVRYTVFLTIYTAPRNWRI